MSLGHGRRIIAGGPVGADVEAASPGGSVPAGRGAIRIKRRPESRVGQSRSSGGGPRGFGSARVYSAEIVESSLSRRGPSQWRRAWARLAERVGGAPFLQGDVLHRPRRRRVRLRGGSEPVGQPGSPCPPLVSGHGRPARRRRWSRAASAPVLPPAAPRCGSPGGALCLRYGAVRCRAHEPELVPLRRHGGGWGQGARACTRCRARSPSTLRGTIGR